MFSGYIGNPETIRQAVKVASVGATVLQNRMQSIRGGNLRMRKGLELILHGKVNVLPKEKIKQNKDNFGLRNWYL